MPTLTLELHVIGEYVRPFTQLLGCCCRMCDHLFFEPSPRCLSLRAVNRTKSTHLLVTLGRHIFARFVWNPPPAPPGSQAQPTAELATAPQPTDVAFCIESKALLNSVLHSAAALSQVTILHDSGVHPPDSVQFAAQTFLGVRKTFLIHLSDLPSERAFVPHTTFTFQAVADPKTWGSFCSSFSSQRITLRPAPSRVLMQAADEVEGPRAALVSVDAQQFAQFKWAAPGISLPGKRIELRPLRSFLFFVDQLQMRVSLRSGGSGIPVLLEAVARNADQAAPLVTHLSLLIAAIDVSGDPAPPPGTSETPLRQEHNEIVVVEAGDANPLSPAANDPAAAAPSAVVSHPPPPTSHGVSSNLGVSDSSVAPLGAVPSRLTPASGLKRARDDIEADSHVSMTAPSASRTAASVAPGGAMGAPSAYFAGLFPIDFNAMATDEDEEEDARYDAFLRGIWGGGDPAATDDGLNPLSIVVTSPVTPSAALPT